jgi:UDPglucose 6-dehydrogenase
MKICVYGLWHLGSVTAACVADAGHQVAGLDNAAEVIEDLNRGDAPVMEFGLEDLIRRGLASKALSFTADFETALRGAEAVWVAFDTPVDEDDRADVDFVRKQVERIFPFLEDQTLVLISSQVPVGTTRQLQKIFRERFPQREVYFAYSPENLRLGKAIEVFTHPDRVVAGCDEPAARLKIEEIFAPFAPRVEWMSIESAEMTKHALNAFLATSVTFINEIAVLCEQVGADAGEVSRGLKSDARIGEKAYLSPGGAYSGGTLARDIRFLGELGDKLALKTPLVSGVEQSNDMHRTWAVRRLNQLLGVLIQKKIAVLGLTYKAGTNTLRRSGALDICRELAAQGALIRAYDPAVPQLPEAAAQYITLADSAEQAMEGADALIVFTGWPEFREINPAAFMKAMRNPLVLDANRFLADALDHAEGLRYITVGMGVV